MDLNELVFRLDEQVKALKAIVDALTVRMQTAETNVTGLQLSKVQIVAYYVGAGAAVGVLFRVFWK